MGAESSKLKATQTKLECIFYPKKRDRIYESLGPLFQGLSTEKASELIYVFVKYLLSAADVSLKEAENRVKYLPKGEETVRTTADKLREERYKMALRDKDRWIGESKIEGKIEAAQEILIDLASEQYGVLPSILEAKIKSIQSEAALRNLSRKIVKINDIKEFQKLLNQVADHRRLKNRSATARFCHHTNEAKGP